MNQKNLIKVEKYLRWALKIGCGHDFHFILTLFEYFIHIEHR